MRASNDSTGIENGDCPDVKMVTQEAEIAERLYEKADCESGEQVI